MEIYKIYKLVKQRFKRKPSDSLLEKITAQFRKLFDQDRSKEELLEIVDTIISLENELPSRLKRYGEEVKEALISGKYSLKRPYPISHFYNESEGDVGTVYIFTSRSKKGQVKLGATTLSMHDREKAYFAKYGYSVVAVKHIKVNKPFELERLVKESIKHTRVAGNVEGDSNEWYSMNIDELYKKIIEINDKR